MNSLNRAKVALKFLSLGLNRAKVACLNRAKVALKLFESTVRKVGNLYV